MMEPLMIYTIDQAKNIEYKYIIQNSHSVSDQTYFNAYLLHFGF